MKGIHTMQLHRFYIAALERVLDWDLPDEVCFQAVPAEAGHLAGLDSDQRQEIDPD